ncbi:MAG: hypothetical protein K5989_06560 [Lachnospiraceae bacterium]|nr:hypothetical protein [Lachnospiraceae bacterium]
MGGNLFSVLFSTIKSKFASIVSKLRLWLSWNFIKTRIIGGIRDFFFKLLDVRPKDKHDYYSVFGWLISKKLAYAIVIIVGVLSIWYISVTTSIFSSLTQGSGMQTYKYNSLLLRLASSRVRILGKSGYLAYEGDVAKGYATGQGTLYDSDENMVYQGAFVKNKFEGEGTDYFESGIAHYRGTFHNNFYEGPGKLFREDGSQEYDGEFHLGYKEGAGKLFDPSGSLIYEGNFSSNNIIYSELLGKNVEEIRKMYNGRQILFEQDPNVGTDTVVYLQDISALYLGISDESAADDSNKADTVYVLSGRFQSGNIIADDIAELKELFGEPIYEGNSSIELPEAVAVNILNGYEPVLNGRVDMDTTEVFSDDIVVHSFDENYMVYVYSFQRGGLIYSFICKGEGSWFEFYGIKAVEDANGAK